MVREETVFGPIKSRRLGNSLGINLLPVNGKICTFDCVYCECGWNRDGRDDTRLPEAREVHQALEERLIRMREENTSVDSFTFSGDGESTIHPDFPLIVDDTLSLRDQYFPQAKVSVLSNASQVHRQEIFAALRKVDNPIMKIDAPTNELIRKINLPAPGYDIARVIEALKGFNGDFILQTMFLRSRDFDSSWPEVLEGWMDIVRLLKPREIMAYTIARPTPATGLSKFSEDEMRVLLAPLAKEGFRLQIKG